ncbi:MAG TPA: FAD-binding oxidoreductase [Gaiellaceae bacterium]
MTRNGRRRRVAVVGCGMFGAAVARHAAQRADVVLIGPERPSETAFGAHYDEGRIVAQLNFDPVWIELVRASLAGMRELDAELVRVCGSVLAIPEAEAPPVVEAAAALRAWLELDVRELPVAERRARFPELAFEESETVLFEPSGCHFSPRRYVALATAAAASAGASLVRRVACRVDVAADGVEVELDDGSCVRADAAVVAAGAFTIDPNLLPVAPALRAKSETYLLAEVDDELLSAGLPCVARAVDDPELGEVYALPPITYPDGRARIKIGANTLDDCWLETPEDVVQWYRGGETANQAAVLRRAFADLFPDVRVRSWSVGRCADGYTTHERPYVDVLEPERLVVVTGGNGRGAQVADGLGALAAELVVEGEWTSELPREHFEFVPAADPWQGTQLLADRKAWIAAA